MAEPTISDLMIEDRTFPPPAAFTGQALVADARSTRRPTRDLEAFWARQARELLSWYEDFHTTLEWDLPFAKWFVGGTLNVSYNCLDRHVEAGRGDRVAYPLGGRARRHPHHHLRRPARRGVPLRQRAQGPRASSGATGSPSTCR